MSTAKRESIGPLLVLVLALLPALIWSISSPLGQKFSSSSSAFTSIGQITGLIGMAMLCLVIILSSRTIFLDKFFGGLNNVYKAHRRFGVASFVLILIHPLTLAFSYLPFSPRGAALFLLPGSDWARNFGIMALLVMMTLIALTILANKMKYQILKYLHKIFGIVFLFSVIHTFMEKGSMFQYSFLRWYMLGLMALGLTAFCYRAIMSGFLAKKYVYLVKDVKQLPAKTVEITMVPKGKPIKYGPGQFIFISFHGRGISSEQHPFSISSSPKDSELKVLVKALGDYTSQLHKLPLGSLAKVEGPFGKLVYSNVKNKSQVWIGGGSGIAPFLGMARNFALAGEHYDIDLYYCAPSKKELVCAEDFAAASACSFGKFKFVPFCQNTRGFITAEKIQKLSRNFNKRDIFLCGPEVMVKNLKKQFNALRIPKYQIHSEEFNLL